MFAGPAKKSLRHFLLLLTTGLTCSIPAQSTSSSLPPRFISAARTPNTDYRQLGVVASRFTPPPSEPIHATLALHRETAITTFAGNLTHPGCPVPEAPVRREPLARINRSGPDLPRPHRPSYPTAVGRGIVAATLGPRTAPFLPRVLPTHLVAANLGQ